MTIIERITTEYIDTEDRIRLAGEAKNTAPVAIWLTQRLLQRLLPALLQWLEGQNADTPRAEILQSFAQQAAKADLLPQTPVQVSKCHSAWLAMSVDITQSNEVIGLTFRGASDERITLTLAAKPLRQWLDILHDAYLRAEWPRDVWPAWVREQTLPDSPQGLLLH